jgi:thioredoxin-like negative regulator of GroEL
MKKFLRKLENMYAAAAFGEAGEFDTAREILGEKRSEKRTRAGKFEKLMMAVTFAEAGEHDTAREIMREEKRAQKKDRVSPRPRKRLQ